MINSVLDDHFMGYALQVGARGLGQVAPNPAVGCILVKDRQVLSAGATQKGGRPHAERMALDAISQDQAKGCTAYVTLEPCSHTGKTAPCAGALIDAGVGRVVIALQDPDPRVNGRGVSMLREAGIAVTTGIRAEEAKVAHAGFISKVTQGKPWIMLKVASSLDGAVATASGHSQWITNASSRRFVHRLRGRYDAIITGIGTVLSDDPLLNCRLAGLENRSPLRIVFDTQLRLPLASQLVKTANDTSLWVITTVSDEERLAPYQKAGVRVISLPVEKTANEVKSLDLSDVLRILAQEGLTRIMVEAGGGLTTAFIRKNLVDTLIWMRAPFAIGGDGLHAIGSLGGITLEDQLRFQRVYTHTWDADVMEVYHNPLSGVSVSPETVQYFL